MSRPLRCGLRRALALALPLALLAAAAHLGAQVSGGGSAPSPSGGDQAASTAAPSSPATPAASSTSPSTATATPTAPSAAPTAQPAALPPGFADTAPKPENPWRRFEIVSLGAFPISLFYVGFGFDLGHYAASNFDSRYAPWPFQSSNSILPTDSERLVRIGSAAALSLLIGGIDAIIHAEKVRAERRRAAAETIELDSKGAGD